MRKFSKKTVALVASIALLVCVGVGGTLAYLLDIAGPIENTFNPSKVTTAVQESFKDGVKSNVMIRNTGDTTAYIRAAVVVTWQDAHGNVYGTLPVEGTDYNIEYDLANGWVKSSDGFYYWNEPVLSQEESETVSGCHTGILIKECTAVEGTNSPEGYDLCVEIIASGIQSVPTSVVTSEWSSGVSGVSGTTLTIKQ